MFRLESAPLHDPVAVAFVIAPELFETVRINVEVETSSPLCLGQTVADFDGITGRDKNVLLATRVDVEGFWRLMVAAMERICHE